MAPCFSDLSPNGRLTKLGEKDVQLIVDTNTPEFLGHKNIWQNSQDKEETNKANSAVVLKSAPSNWVTNPAFVDNKFKLSITFFSLSQSTEEAFDIPSTSDPQVIVMTSKKSGEGGSTGKAACLARNFRTKNISLEMPSEEVLYEQGTSILTSEGLYNAIKVVNVTKDTELTCTAKFDNSTITSVPATEEEAEEQLPEPSDRVCNSTDPSAQAVTGQMTLEQHPREVTVQEGDAVTFECSMREMI
ncbi:hypothetical protein DUI87_21977 [Hirundo rustica rustica]|uniref:Ig-like domain-containing protein n=1 Tax=Hirundo rustica rustica TaxID=333673 RepID=A0A3M0JKI8_HIRRU|nr:hypothetical protein DUI87_21977 [Hirundo rustica rustica]